MDENKQIDENHKWIMESRRLMTRSLIVSAILFFATTALVFSMEKSDVQVPFYAAFLMGQMSLVIAYAVSILFVR